MVYKAVWMPKPVVHPRDGEVTLSGENTLFQTYKTRWWKSEGK